MYVLLCEHDIACAFRWGVALIGVILTRYCSPRLRTPFQVQVMYRKLTLVRYRRYDESRTVALKNLIVKKLDFTCTILYIKEL